MIRETKDSDILYLLSLNASLRHATIKVVVKIQRCPHWDPFKKTNRDDMFRSMNSIFAFEWIPEKKFTHEKENETDRYCLEKISEGEDGPLSVNPTHMKPFCV